MLIILVLWFALAGTQVGRGGHMSLWTERSLFWIPRSSGLLFSFPQQQMTKLVTLPHG
jgi:hypothetical protein